MTDSALPHLVPADGPPEAPRRPRLVAIMTVLGWNVLPLVGLIVWVIVTVSHPQEGEDWSGVIAAILVVVGGGAIVVATGAGVAIAAIVMTRQLRAGASPTTAAGMGWGTLSAFLGWLVPAAALLVMTVVRWLQ